MIKTWNVYVYRIKAICIGQVHENSERQARNAALSKFAITEDEYFEAQNAGKEITGISPGDEFSVSRA